MPNRAGMGEKKQGGCCGGHGHGKSEGHGAHHAGGGCCGGHGHGKSEGHGAHHAGGGCCGGSGHDRG